MADSQSVYYGSLNFEDITTICLICLHALVSVMGNFRLALMNDVFIALRHLLSELIFLLASMGKL